jgi:hypothetical protein
MSTPCLIFVRSWIPRQPVNSCCFCLAMDDEEKTSFIMPFRIFCYIKMASGLKNRGATYQKCVHIVLKNQIGRNVEAYIDDIVVKSEKRGDLLDDLKETFDNLHKYKMMRNPKKMCLWRVIREVARLHGIVQGDRCKSHQGGSH